MLAREAPLRSVAPSRSVASDISPSSASHDTHVHSTSQPPTSRADVVGSLLRPQYLLDAREQLERGELTPAAFKAIEDRAVDEAVALQEAAGLDVITDGEMRRYAFYGHLVEALEGFDKYAGWSITFRDGEGHEANLKRPVVVEKLKWRRQMAVEEFTYLRGRTRAQVKVTLLSAQQAAAYYDPERSKGAYATRDAYLADLVDFTRREIDELRRLGCEYVQIDAPQYAALLDEKMREGYRQRGSDPDKMLDANIELDNAIVAGHLGHDLRHSHLPRQSQEHVLRLRRLRPDCRARVQADPVRSLPARI